MNLIYIEGFSARISFWHVHGNVSGFIDEDGVQLGFYWWRFATDEVKKSGTKAQQLPLVNLF